MGRRFVACIGSGLIGKGWATLFAWKGYSVNLHDLVEPKLDSIRSNLSFLAKNGLLEREEVDTKLKRINTTTTLEEAVVGCDYVQESVTENLSVKIEIFERLDALTSPSTILTSSTSTLNMTDISKETQNPERCIVAHPWNPPHLVPLVELVPGEKTSDETIEKTRQLMERIGKVPVVQKKEAVGTIGNRITAAILREAINIVVEGIAAPEEVDKAITAGPGFRSAVLGPFLTYYLAGGEGGIASYLEHIGPTMFERWKTLGSFSSLSKKDKEKLIGEVLQMEPVLAMSIGELVQRRDEELVTLMSSQNIQQEQTNGE